MSDAVNIMLWSKNAKDGSPGYARWMIFPPPSVPGLRKFIAECKGGEKDGNGVISASVFITPGDLPVLRGEYGIIPRVFHQHVNEAVYIPAGCPHQVCYH